MGNVRDQPSESWKVLMAACLAPCSTAPEAAVTGRARRIRPDLQSKRPQGIEGLVWDAMVCEGRPVQTKDIVCLTDLTVAQVCKAIERMKKRGVIDGYRVPGYPTGYRMAYHLVLA